MPDLTAIPFVDHHSHPWLRRWRDLDAAGFRQCFSESPSRDYTAEHVPRSLPYLRALRMLGEVLQCDADEAAILRERRAAPPDAYLRHLFSGTNVSTVVIDDGYPPANESLDLVEMSSLLAVPTRRVLRLEALVEQLTPLAASFSDVLARFDAVVGNARPAAVALKTIAAYRSGLRLVPVDARAAEAAWSSWQASIKATGSNRLVAKDVLDYFVLRALDHAARQELAMQFHTGYGDPDLDLREANPLHLRPIMEDARYRSAKLVLLHAAYPFTREGAYLAAVYPHVYLDVSTALPPLGTSELVGALRQSLAVAPASKLLLSTDAARIPEHHALGALLARQALSAALDSVVTKDRDLGAHDADALAEWLLRRTAQAVYGDAIQ